MRNFFFWWQWVVFFCFFLEIAAMALTAGGRTKERKNAGKKTKKKFKSDGRVWNHFRPPAVHLAISRTKEKNLKKKHEKSRQHRTRFRCCCCFCCFLASASKKKKQRSQSSCCSFEEGPPRRRAKTRKNKKRSPNRRHFGCLLLFCFVFSFLPTSESIFHYAHHRDSYHRHRHSIALLSRPAPSPIIWQWNIWIGEVYFLCFTTTKKDWKIIIIIIIIRQLSPVSIFFPSPCIYVC